MGEVQARLDNLDRLLEEKQFWLKVLGLWNVAKEAGYPSEQVKSFTFRDEFLTKEEKVVQRRARAAGKTKYSGKTHHNALRLVDDSVVQIPLVKRPEPPEHMNCSLKAGM